MDKNSINKKKILGLLSISHTNDGWEEAIIFQIYLRGLDCILIIQLQFSLA